MKILYQCEICNEVYDSREDAEACEARGVKKARLAVGQKVQMEEWLRIGWTEVEIIKIVNVGHEQGYLLSSPVRVSDSNIVGRFSEQFEEDYADPLFDSNFEGQFAIARLPIA